MGDTLELDKEKTVMLYDFPTSDIYRNFGDDPGVNSESRAKLIRNEKTLTFDVWLAYRRDEKSPLHYLKYVTWSTRVVVERVEGQLVVTVHDRKVGDIVEGFGSGEWPKGLVVANDTISKSIIRPK